MNKHIDIRDFDRLSPIRPPLKKEQEAKEQFLEFLKEAFYKPLLNSLKHTENYKIKFNAVSNEITEAFKSGKLRLTNNKVQGTFNVKLSKELRNLGGKYSATQKAFIFDNIPMQLVSLEEQRKVALSISRQNINSFLDRQTAFKELKQQDFSEIYRGFLDANQLKMEKIKSVAIQPLTNKQIADKAKKYAKNIKLPIKNFLDEEMQDMRQFIASQTFQGLRQEEIAKHIQQRYGIAKNKAQFWAEQESNLVLAEYTKEKYQQAGVQYYQWSTSHDNRVRHDHAMLDKQIFSFDNPPIVDQATGKRCNPGEDFRCRCVAIPLRKRKYEELVRYS